MSNLQSGLPRRRRLGCAMAAYDRLPPALRRWVMQAALPWSATSVQRLWDRAVRQTRGDLAAALARLDATERRCLDRDGLPRAQEGTATGPHPFATRNPLPRCREGCRHA